MKEIVLNLIQAIKGGDLKTVKELFSSMSETETEEILLTHAQGSVAVKRPCGESEVRIWNPTLLMLAVTEWYPAIVNYLASFQLGVEAAHTTDDQINSPAQCAGVTPLHVAAILGKLQMMQVLLSNGAQVNTQTAFGDTPLYEACFEGHQAIVTELLSRDADVTLTNRKRISCLMIAAFADHPGVIKSLVEGGADLNHVDNEGRNVLFYCVAAGKIDTLAYLLDQGAEIVSDRHGVNLMMEAAHHGNADMLQYLVRYDTLLNMDVNAYDDVGRNVLFYLLEHDNLQCLQMLLDAGAMISRMDDGRTLLMSAALSSNSTVVHYLVTNAEACQVDLNEKDLKGRNVLFYCITGGNLELFDYLASGGVRIESSADGVTLLMQAVAKNRADLACYLLENANKCDLDVNAEDADGWNAVFYAVASGFLDLFMLLTQFGVDCRHSNDNRTVLMQAAVKGNFELVRHILEHAKDFSVYINQRDNDGWNALFYTIQGGHMDVFTFLLRRGAKVCVALNGATLLMEAVDKNQMEFVEYLLKNRGQLDIDVNQCDADGNNALVYAISNGNYTMFQTLHNAGCAVVADSHQRTLLMHACLHGHMELVRHLVNFSDSLGIDVNQRDKDGRNVIFYCIENGHQEVLEFLVLSGVRPQSDKCQRTNIMQACRSGHLDILKYLINNSDKLDLDMNAVDANGENALFYASRCDKPEIYLYLLDQGVNVICNKHGISILAQSLHDKKHQLTQAILQRGGDLRDAVQGKDVGGCTSLHHFVMMGDLDTLTALSQYYSAAHDHDSTGTTLLMYSCARSGDHQLSITKYLIEKLNVDVCKHDDKYRNALMHAVITRNYETVMYLLQSTGTPIEADFEGTTILMVAAANGSSTISEALIQSERAKDLALKLDNYGRNAFHHCAMHGKQACLGLLKSYNCDINARDEQGLTPLIYAVRGGHPFLMTSLLKRAARVELCDVNNRNALHHCFCKPSPDVRCVKQLLRYGVDVNHHDNSGVTSLMLACQTCAKTEITIIKLLLEAGANPILQDAEGKDAFDYCAFDAEYVKALMRDKSEMHSRQKEALISYSDDMAAILEVNSVLRGLTKHHVFTKTLTFEVMKNIPSERVPKLLELLFYRGAKAFNVFCKVLKEEGEVELAFNLMKDSYRKEVEIYW